MRARHATFLLAVLGLVVSARTVLAEPWVLAPGEFVTELRGTLFSADDYHDLNGDRRPFPFPGQFEQRQMVSHSEFGWKGRTNVFLEIPASSVTFRTGDGAFSGTSTGLSDITLGARYGLLRGASAASATLQWQAPLGYDPERLPGLGDGLQELAAKVEAGTSLLGRAFVQAGVGYAYRYFSITRDGAEGERWSNRILTSAGAGIWVADHLLVGGRYEGLVTSSHGERLEDEDGHLVGPLVVYRVNDHVDAFAGSRHTAAATNQFHRNEYFAGVAFRSTKLDRLQGFLGSLAAPGPRAASR